MLSRRCVSFSTKISTVLACTQTTPLGDQFPRKQTFQMASNLAQRAEVAGMDPDTAYNDAVAMLHTSLRSGESLLKIRRDAEKVRMMRTFLRRLGLYDDPKGLDIIHISGTKGKGSTCAFCDSILRHHGYKTGMFSSPHMNETRERIRINGKPISKEMFAHYFWEVYTKLKQTKTRDALNMEGGMPAYFNFTVIMAFYVFIEEKVNVGIFEVGIGGEFDGTNFFLRPAVCGVASLGYDHLTILGETLDQIAWHKAGIFKTGCPAVTMEQEDFPPQPKYHVFSRSPTGSIFSRVWSLLSKVLWPYPTLSAWFFRLWGWFSRRHPMQVLLDRAVNKKCPLYLAPSISEDVLQRVKLGISGKKQYNNAALAIQICKIIRNRESDFSCDVATKRMKVADIPRLDTSLEDLDPATVKGLETCYWPGRTEIIHHEGITYYLDGAHTGESIENCAHWFKEEAGRERSDLERKNGKVIRMLVFNVTKNRNPANLLGHLTSCEFDEATFTPNLMSTVHHANIMDHYDSALNKKELAEVPIENSKIWSAMVDREGSSHVFPCILQALSWVTQGREPLVKVADPTAMLPDIPLYCLEATHIQVLVTGSLLLVGPVLGILKPGFND
ncbi:hypothetical protein RRG08_009706 [Elysia crispata]|uniref:tetrahydrofolate synthase n=1 Tax=Elysia crispata TaxID=231223 RepID=A0AAE1DJ21_9GAST|nr:hypothetical protein RRG08_009706 [Elysia crispata]